MSGIDAFITASDTGGGYAPRLEWNGQRGFFKFHDEEIIPTAKNKLVMYVDVHKGDYGYREWVQTVDDDGNPIGDKKHPQDSRAKIGEPMPPAPASFGEKDGARLAVWWPGYLAEGDVTGVFEWACVGKVLTDACKPLLVHWNKEKPTKEQCMKLTIDKVGEAGSNKNPYPEISFEIVAMPPELVGTSASDEEAPF